ncbi:MAG: hypothetical protein V4508_06145 [Pseudomonadota bacterium]
MKTILKTTAGSLVLAAMAVATAPAFAAPAHVDVRIGLPYGQVAYVQPERVEYRSYPAYGYNYQDRSGWREEQRWREHEWQQRRMREHQWRDRDERRYEQHDWRRWDGR